MNYGAGFYKLDDYLLYGPNFVIHKDYHLKKDEKDMHTYPVDGWHWFDSLEDACIFFEININDYLSENSK